MINVFTINIINKYKELHVILTLKMIDTKFLKMPKK